MFTGDDIHEVGIINDNLLVCMMINKLKLRTIESGAHLYDISMPLDFNFIDSGENKDEITKFRYSSPQSRISRIIMETIGNNL